MPGTCVCGRMENQDGKETETRLRVSEASEASNKPQQCDPHVLSTCLCNTDQPSLLDLVTEMEHSQNRTK